ncbi:MAG: DUF4910 domain-containing protein [Magnetovibrio sp.]|nr:DUF4910 domain-containing protein [Magnetovibrio sp.]
MPEQDDPQNIGQSMFGLAEELFPICRSITGDGVRQTLSIIQRELPNLTIHEVPSGTKCFDWVVPPEWNIRDAYIIDPSGDKVVDFNKSNLHVVSYSTPVDESMSLDELQEHLYSIPDDPDAIPYITSYYEEKWGFCLTHNQRENLKPGTYKVVIDSTLKLGHLTYGELILPGSTAEEVLISTYVCHPSMANNELSGPIVTSFLGKWLSELSDRRYTYRIIFIPETIGSICYLSKNIEQMKKNVVAGFNVSCIGDDRGYSYIASRKDGTLADRIVNHVLEFKVDRFTKYSFLERGSDERQYCAPGVDLPVVTVMRGGFNDFPEYHTSRDDLTVISPEGLFGGYELLRTCIECLEMNLKPVTKILCEPQLSKRDLYPQLSTKEYNVNVRNLMNVIAYSDGQTGLLEMAERFGSPMWEMYDILAILLQAEIVSVE